MRIRIRLKSRMAVAVTVAETVEVENGVARGDCRFHLRAFGFAKAHTRRHIHL